jgi:long-chain acyl-CoA synthetase
VNVGSFLTRSGACWPGRPAVRQSGRAVTYAQLDERVDALAAGLRARGVRRGERVVLWMHNRSEYVELLFACWKSGLVVVPVNAALLADDIANVVADSDAAVLAFGPEQAEGAAQVTVPHLIGFSDGPGMSYDDVLAAGRGAPDQTIEVEDSAPAWQFYTSGTTGRPKGALLTHANLAFVVVGWCADLHHMGPEDVVLHCAPLSHGAGFHALTAVARGAEQIVHRRFDAAAVLREIADSRVTTTWVVPTQLRRLLDDDSFETTDLSSLNRLIYGGSPAHQQDLEEARERLGRALCQLYGQGESPMTITYLRPEQHQPGAVERGVTTSAGTVRTGMEIGIVDADDLPVPTGEVGEIVVRGPAVMTGYHNRPEQTAEALRGGWLHTGDIGRLDERGFLYVLDRIKDMIITGGMNVYAREVEDVLLRHDAIHEAAVFGVPDRTWGEAVTAAVTTTDGAAPDELMDHCRGRLAGFKRPKAIHIVPSLPKNAYGKVMKRELRDELAAVTAPAAGRPPKP